MNEKTGNNQQSGLRWMVLVTVIVGTFLGRLDQTIVNLALPKIINDFSITVSQAGWIATAYILALVRNIAGAFGISLFATILNNRMEDVIIQVSRFSIINTTNPLLRGEAMILMTLKAQIDGFRTVFLIGAAVVFASAVYAYFSLNIKELDLDNKIEMLME
jgi:MFS family permease